MTYPKIALAIIGLVPFLTNAKSLPINHEETLTIGALATFTHSDYNVDNKVGVLPLFLYDNNRLYAEGSEAGFYAYKDNQHWLRAGLTYDGRSFDPDDADQSLKKLDKRKSSVNAHISYMYITPIGGFEAKFATDLLDKSDGQNATLAHRSKFDLLDNRLTIYPKIGVAWHSKKYNQYYYGVSAKESATSGVQAYHAKASYSPFASVSAEYQLNNHWGLFVNQRLDWLSSTQKDSPLTDDKLKSSTYVGITYEF